MTPSRTGGRRGGNLEIERTIAGVRIRRSAETKNPVRFAQIVSALEKAGADDRVDVLEAFALPRGNPGRLSVSELLAADRKGKPASSLQAVKLRQYLWDRTDEVTGVEVGAISRALARVTGKKTRARYVTSFVALMKKAEAYLPVDARVGDLAKVPWDTVASEWGTSGADWMHLKRAVSRFATLHMGDKWDEFARRLRQSIPNKKVRKRRPKLSIAKFKEIAGNAPAHAAVAYWVLVITGVRIGEYLASDRRSLDKESFTYTPPGAEKNELGDVPLTIDPRWWPYMEAGIPSTLHYNWLRKHWIRACAKAGVSDVTLHDLRHCAGQWAINKGVAESKVQAQLRHENPAQTRDYVMQHATGEVSTALADAILPKAKGRRRA